ncbi:hypothetical protein [Metabacillus litoralis]|uniref:hypothetical protein n=1 Tax=Metabacillus litoralis TaxID=152268 RepID=UPI001CFCA75E|nr:hypothetical protein [Metabacillus litoralis]
MKALILGIVFCFLLSGGINDNVTTYDGFTKLPKIIDTKDQAGRDVPVKINLTVREKKGKVLEFDSNVSLLKDIENLKGSTSPYIRITNLENGKVIYSDFNGINQNNKREIRVKEMYSSNKSIKLDSGKYEVYYEYEMKIKTNKSDPLFGYEKSGGFPIEIK